jgi:hypothetical protein
MCFCSAVDGDAFRSLVEHLWCSREIEWQYLAAIPMLHNASRCSQRHAMSNGSNQFSNDPIESIASPNLAFHNRSSCELATVANLRFAPERSLADVSVFWLSLNGTSATKQPIFGGSQPSRPPHRRERPQAPANLYATSFHRFGIQAGDPARRNIRVVSRPKPGRRKSLVLPGL